MTKKAKDINTNIEIKGNDSDELISFIPKKWEEWNDAREPNLALIRETQKHLYPDKAHKKEDSFSGEIKTEMNKLPKVYKTRESAIAHYWNSTFKSLPSSFNLDFSPKQEDLALLQGNTNADMTQQVQQYIQSARDNANLMKESILDSWNKAGAKKEFRKAIKNWVDKGEAILFVTWDTQYKKVRRGGKVQQVPSYDGVKIVSVDPENYVMDVSRKGKDGCPEIYRDWVTYSSVKDNPAYTAFLKPQDLTDLQNMADDNQYKDNSNAGDKKDWDDKAVNKGLLELLDYWGDIKLNDRYLPNMHISVIARKFVICFEYNPHITDPFIYCEYEEHPQTKRGIGPLARTLPLNDEATDLHKKMKKGLAMTINKPYLAPKGAFSGKVNVDEGVIIEYDSALMSQAPEPLDFTGFEHGWTFQNDTENEIEETSGEYKYDLGEDNAQARTATEASGIMAGQNVRRGLYISDLSEYLLIPCAEKTGELLANYKDGQELIKTTDNAGNTQFKIIDNTIRQGEYEYQIGDTQAILEKQANLDKFSEITQQVAQITPLNGKEIARYAYSTLQIENPDRFLQSDPTEEAFKQLPDQAKQTLMQVAQDPSTMQKLQQPQLPNAEEMKDSLAKAYIDNIPKAPTEFKQVTDMLLGLDPTQKEDLKNGARAGTGSNQNEQVA